MTSHIHIINKDDLSVHKILSAPLPSSPLAPGHIRVKSHILGITLNNHSYAQLGDSLAWWSAYPVPPEVASAGKERWGIVPAWGYGKVLESKVEGIPENSLLYGFWPTSSRPVDLKLEPHGSSTSSFNEKSEARNKLLTMYNRFVLVSNEHANKPTEELAWEANCAGVWGAGWIFTEYVFAPARSQPITPAGDNNVWTKEDADVSSAVVINLAGSSKTAMSISFNFRQRGKDQSPPLAVLDVTSSPDRYPRIQSSVEHKVVSYADLASPSTLSWLADLNPSRVILTDSGAPLGTAQAFHDAVFASSAAPKSFYYILIGTDPRELSNLNERAKKFQFNTSPVIDAAEERDGDAVHTGRYESFLSAVKLGVFNNIELVVGEGISGDGGIEGAWTKIKDGSFPRDKALVFRV